MLRWAAIFILTILIFSCESPRQTQVFGMGQSDEYDTASISYFPLNNERDLDVLINEISDDRIVLLGESTHGTHEFYTWRIAITKRLVMEKGFDLIAVEGDWTDSYKINEFIRGERKDSVDALNVLKEYDRWPSSMWGNHEMIPLITWLNEHNQVRPVDQKTGFYGLDVYSFWEWTKDSINTTPEIREEINKLREYFKPFKNDALLYAEAVKKARLNDAPDSYRNGQEKRDAAHITSALWEEVKKHYKNKMPLTVKDFLLWQQARLSFNAEQFFRAMSQDRVRAINLRDGHMAETIKNLLNWRGINSKIIVWCHNGHAGDAHYSSMGSAGYTSVAEILKNDVEINDIYKAGLGTYKGTVLAGYYWNGPLIEQKVLPAKEGTWEDILHKLGPENKIILSKDLKNHSYLNDWIEFRSIGAAYPGAAIYSRSIISKRFDAFVFIDSTKAIKPITNQ